MHSIRGGGDDGCGVCGTLVSVGLAEESKRYNESADGSGGEGGRGGVGSLRQKSPIRARMATKSDLGRLAYSYQ